MAVLPRDARRVVERVHGRRGHVLLLRRRRGRLRRGARPLRAVLREPDVLRVGREPRARGHRVRGLEEPAVRRLPAAPAGPVRAGSRDRGPPSEKVRHGQPGHAPAARRPQRRRRRERACGRLQLAQTRARGPLRPFLRRGSHGVGRPGPRPAGRPRAVRGAAVRRRAPRRRGRPPARGGLGGKAGAPRGARRRRPGARAPGGARRRDAAAVPVVALPLRRPRRRRHGQMRRGPAREPALQAREPRVVGRRRRGRGQPAVLGEGAGLRVGHHVLRVRRRVLRREVRRVL